MQAARGAPLIQAGAEPARRPRRLGMALGAAAIVLSTDVASKVIAVEELSERDPVELIDGVLELTLTRNPGAAFSIGVGATVVFTLIAAAVVVVVARTATRLRSIPWAFALGLLLGGALGNLSDRMFRSPGPLRGEVVDWIRIPHWPVFNLADVAITTGAILAVLLSLRGRALDGSQ